MKDNQVEKDNKKGKPSTQWETIQRRVGDREHYHPKQGQSTTGNSSKGNYVGTLSGYQPACVHTEPAALHTVAATCK